MSSASENSTTSLILVTEPNYPSSRGQFWQGVRDILPLALAVLPWGLLAGSLAVQTGLSIAQAIAMSALVFAGAAQLLTLNMVQEGQGVLAIFLSIFVLTAQHLLYGLKFRTYIKDLSCLQRLLLGFLLTDELFAVGVQHQRPTFVYLCGAGLTFYLAWCLFSVIGVLLAYQVPELQNWHLDFSIAALFILLLVPLIRKQATVIGVMITLLGIFWSCYIQQLQGIILAALLGMWVSALLDTESGEMP